MDFRQWAIARVEKLTELIETPYTHPANVESAVSERRGVMEAYHAAQAIAEGREPKQGFFTDPMRRWNDEVVNACTVECTWLDTGEHSHG